MQWRGRSFGKGRSLKALCPRPRSARLEQPVTFAERREWVEDNLDRDLVIYAARENIFFVLMTTAVTSPVVVRRTPVISVC